MIYNIDLGEGALIGDPEEDEAYKKYMKKWGQKLLTTGITSGWWLLDDERFGSQDHHDCSHGAITFKLFLLELTTTGTVFSIKDYCIFT